VRASGIVTLFARLFALLAAAALAGCAEFAFLLEGDALDFELNGRIAVRYRDEASSGNVAWRHRAGGDEVLLTTPLGQGVARIVRDGRETTLTTADAKEHRASDPEALTEAVLGFRLPLDGLADWVRGRPSIGPAEVERDASGRVSRIAQSGWVVELLAWGDDGRPSRLRLLYPGIDLRLAIGEWKSVAP